jgi:hypothetical protein
MTPLSNVIAQKSRSYTVPSAVIGKPTRHQVRFEHFIGNCTAILARFTAAVPWIAAHLDDAPMI